MENINNEDIFNLLKSHEFESVRKLIESKKLTNLDFRDSNYNYFIQYIIVNLLPIALRLLTDSRLLRSQYNHR